MTICEECHKEFTWFEDGTYTPICNDCQEGPEENIIDEEETIIDDMNSKLDDIVDFLADNMITEEEYEELDDEEKKKYD